ncbi:glutathione reductase (NADPH) [Neolewinella xylanilytica]|uniref:Glutathione reductase (NADPH) n=1 Tax=Neolewinella xylanilytica TaxID=1514080 RepID=A0A2S6I483_9BACT|nr:NAD(P)/FAD-dependent oxidoreductase [Neolewinella xylanilytica]PPK85986.1 glutathione reductase (NADPH) [Neolewinella xylanilytica]
MSDKQYEVIVVGAGSSGQSVALAAVKAGKSAALIEGRAFGGTCPLRGCDPKLVLHAAAEAMYRVERLLGKGFTGKPDFSWSDLMEWKRGFTEPVPESSRAKMRDNGIETYQDYATFIDSHTLDVGGTRLRGEIIVLATGMRPAPLDIPGNEYLLTSDEFLEMDDLPAEMVVVGGGYIGTETAHIAHALGCQVTMIITEDEPLDKFDHDLAALLRQADEDRGIQYQINSKATAVRKAGDRFEVDVEDTAGQTTTLRTDRVIHCAGRVPNTKRLQLDKVGIETDEKQRIKVDDGLRTNLDHVYALGDCAASGLPLTPVGTYAASVLNDNLFKGATRKVDYYPIPTVAFALPGMASVGMTAREAEASDRNLSVHYKVANDWFHARHRNAAVFAFKLIVDDDRDVLVGAHLLGPGATELINLLYLVIRQEIPTSEIKRMIFAYPTAASTITSMLRA